MQSFPNRVKAQPPRQESLAEIVLLAVVGAFGLTACSSPTASMISSPPTAATLRETICEGKETITDLADASIVSSSSPGFNAAFYYTVPFERRLDLTKLGTVDLAEWRAGMLRDMEKQMRHELAVEIDKHPERWPFRSGLRTSLEDRTQPSRWPAEEMPVEVIDQRGTVDCRDGSYIFHATIAVPRQPLTKMPELDRAIDGGMQVTLAESLAALRQRGVVEIDLPGIALQRLRERVNPGEIGALANRYQKQLAYVDEETKLLIKWLRGDTIKVAPFETAEYTLSGDMTLVLRALSSAFVDVAEPQAAYQIAVVGRADSRPLGTRTYSGAAEVTLPRGGRVIYDPRAAARPTRLEDNQQLSVARGHAAAGELFTGLRSHANVTVLYGGDGVVEGVQTEAGRRLEITVKKVE